MKKILYRTTISAILISIVLIALSSCNAIYPKLPVKTENGIQFITDSLNFSIAKSKTENRPLFVMVHANYCSVCRKMLKDVFPEKEVGDYYNTKFVNLILDIDAGSTDKFNNDYQIQGTPTFLFFAPDGHLIKKTSGYMSKQTLIEFAQNLN